MLLSQIGNPDGSIMVVAREGKEAYAVRKAGSVYQMVLDCLHSGHELAAHISALGLGPALDLEEAYENGRLLAPITHPDPSHLHLTGTGLTHLGSAATRDAMHKKAEGEAVEKLTDSMKIFRMGVEGGKPATGAPGVQPEWFYKGNGFNLAVPGGPLLSPAFADDAGEEPEIAGIYVIGDDGTPFRVGFALSNEFSDHVMERQNYLYLAHSKLRPASFGPEIRIGNLPDDVRGISRIRRAEKVIFEKPFLSGESNMSHSIANLEHHHFKYALFRQPGDVHIHMFGTATLSFADGVRTLPGDEFEIAAEDFGLPLRNRLVTADPADARRRVGVRAL
jgi:hypothetical protein